MKLTNHLAVTYLLGRLAMKQKSYVHTTLGQSEYENDDRKLGALLLPEVADSSDAQNRKFYLVAPFAPVGCTGHPIPYRGIFNSAASQHWAPLKHSSGFWADVTGRHLSFEFFHFNFRFYSSLVQGNKTKPICTPIRPSSKSLKVRIAP